MKKNGLFLFLLTLMSLSLSNLPSFADLVTSNLGTIGSNISRTPEIMISFFVVILVLAIIAGVSIKKSKYKEIDDESRKD